MTQSTLVPFVRTGLDILFVGLNPARGSSLNRHYFSVNQAFWNQLADAGLITEYVDKATADTIVFGSTEVNCHHWSFGITDLVASLAESNSTKVRPTKADSVRLRDDIIQFRPKTAVLLHSKVVDHFARFLQNPKVVAGQGLIGRLVPSSPTVFFSVPFPHGNAITSDEKVERYKEIKGFLEEMGREAKQPN